MKSPLLLTLLLVVCLSTNATHNSGGHISYASISGSFYEVAVNLYHNIGGPYHPAVQVDFGDGFSDYAYIINTDTIHSRNMVVHTYYTTHTWSNPGNYEITMEDPNRTSGILNIPNSVNQSFTLKSEIVISPFFINNAAYNGEYPIFLASSNVEYSHTPTFIDSNHDSLHHELVVPLGSNGMPIVGYTFPIGLNIHPLSGHLRWQQPATLGEYTVAIKVSEYLNGTYVGYTILDFNITVDNFNHMPTFSGNFVSLPTDAFGEYVVYLNPGDTLSLDISYIDNASYGYDLRSFSETFFYAPPGQAGLVVTPGSASMFANYLWVPDTSQVRNHPWIITFRGGAGFTHFARYDLTIMAYVGVQPTAIAENTTTKEANIYPNPMVESATISFDKALHKGTLTIYDSVGKTVFQSNPISGSNYELDPFSDESGLYFYQIWEDGKNIYSGKLLVH